MLKIFPFILVVIACLLFSPALTGQAEQEGKWQTYGRKETREEGVHIRRTEANENTRYNAQEADEFMSGSRDDRYVFAYPNEDQPENKFTSGASEKLSAEADVRSQTGQ
ncbi:MAG: hypothetical protein PHW46_06400 [Candidatus Omnitrophica bacterium]|nr:hypothetical protein [Candidatus Omnitrophota bacterium]